MTRQEIFDKVCEHLMKQGERAMRTGRYGHSYCAYRGDNGSKCAAGCLIPDELYDERMEGKNITAVMRGYAEVGKALGGEDNVCIIHNLQAVHDNCGPALWAEKLNGVAQQFSLTPPACIQA